MKSARLVAAVTVELKRQEEDRAETQSAQRNRRELDSDPITADS
jgi:hypothetical protein